MSKIDISLKERQDKHQADTAKSIDWQPVGRRIKILPDHETLSAVIDVKTTDAFVRGTIVAVGPIAGMADDGVTRLETFKAGQRVIYNRKHELTYLGADGVKHIFLQSNSDVNSIIAVEGAE